MAHQHHKSRSPRPRQHPRRPHRTGHTMTMTTCIECGVISTTARCPAHQAPARPKKKTNTNHAAFKNNTRWKKFSKRLRRLSPHCEMCGTSDDLTVDHIVRVTDRPEWTYEIDNCRVLCRRDNGRISTTPATPEVEATIAAKIEARHARRPGGINQPNGQSDPRRQSKFGLVVPFSTIEEGV